MERQQGKLITFCGLDGAGKTSMINLCRDYFTEKGVDVVLTRQPTTEFRQRKDFRTFVDCGDFSPYDFKALSLAAMADRLQHVNKFIVPLINEGKTVICDRYFFSCIVNHRAMGYVDDAWLYAITQEFVMPNLAFFLDIPVSVSVARVRQRLAEKNRMIDINYQEKLRQEYLKIAEQFGGIVIASSEKEDNTFRKIIEFLDKL